MSFFRYRKDEEPVGVLLRRLMAAYGLDDKLREERLKAAWPELVGALAVKYTGKPVIKGHKMIVPVKSAAFRHELMMQKSRLIEELNQTANCPGFLHDIIFR